VKQLAATVTIWSVSLITLHGSAAEEIYLGSGVKAGEIRDTSAIIHVRLTAAPDQDDSGRIPGCEGTARLQYGLDESGENAATTQWAAATADQDYSIQFQLKDLISGRRYYYRVHYRRSSETTKRSQPFSFKTAPAPEERGSVKFQVTTGQDYRGENTYRHMAAQKPDFLVSTGDNVYYDGPPKARDVQGAYDAYQMMYGLPLMKKYFEHVGGYFEKDDHDYRFNDADRWQQWKAGDGGRRRGKKGAKPEKWLTHEEGMMVFKQVFPMSDPTYRTFRWGKGLQLWLVEGRDYRSPNAMPDGPDKTLWGKRQLAWLKRTLLESDADWRVLISPTPIIGPDRVTKNDNHANPKGFWTEGQAFLDWMKENKLNNLTLICGDRHWQYESLDQRNGRKIYEYSCGPTCDEHTANVPPITEAHRGVTQPYSGSRGGFLTVTYQTDRTLTFEFFDQNGTSQYRRVFQSAPEAD
jgi:phosphodiesterase/alkaline phosphatase D-like protein